MAGLAWGWIEVHCDGVKLALVMAQKSDFFIGQNVMGLYEGRALLALIGVAEAYERGKGVVSVRGVAWVA